MYNNWNGRKHSKQETTSVETWNMNLSIGNFKTFVILSFDPEQLLQQDYLGIGKSQLQMISSLADVNFL